MKRIPLSAGGWFDESEAQCFGDGYGGRTVQGGETQLELLWRTRHGQWILNTWREGRCTETEIYKKVEAAEALRWVVSCCLEDQIPEEFAELIGDLEV